MDTRCEPTFQRITTEGTDGNSNEYLRMTGAGGCLNGGTSQLGRVAVCSRITPRLKKEKSRGNCFDKCAGCGKTGEWVQNRERMWEVVISYLQSQPDESLVHGCLRSRRYNYCGVPTRSKH